jgi:hypothetical protein
MEVRQGGGMGCLPNSGFSLRDVILPNLENRMGIKGLCPIRQI